ncbi:hypothetical protein TNCV_3515021 [Trichonephila clavipes]|nr:hypothetical protein TNCV_3515021 [Trichonephila clavipes]
MTPVNELMVCHSRAQDHDHVGTAASYIYSLFLDVKQALFYEKKDIYRINKDYSYIKVTEITSGVDIQLNGLQQSGVLADFSPAHPRPMEISCAILTV